VRERKICERAREKMSREENENFLSRGKREENMTE
jgi:hypothetical protein